MEIQANDKLDILIALAISQGDDPDIVEYRNLDTSDVVFSKEFYKKQNRAIRRYKYKPIINKVRKYSGRVAILLMALISAATIAIAAIPPIREAFVKAIVEWHDEYLTVSFDIDTPKEEQAETEADVPEADEQDNEEPAQEDESQTQAETKTPPTTIEEVRKPTYVPEGVIEDVYQILNLVSVDYYFEDVWVYSFEQTLLKENDMYVNSEGAKVEYVLINGHEATTIENSQNSSSYIIWNDGEYAYHLISEVYDINYLTVIAESVSSVV